MEDSDLILIGIKVSAMVIMFTMIMITGLIPIKMKAFKSN